MRRRRSRLGRPFYVVLLPVVADTWSALDDPLLPFDPSISASESRHSKRVPGRYALPRFGKRFVIHGQLKASHRYLASITKGPAARDIAVLQVP